MAFAMTLTILLAFLMVSCGKKGPPTLKAYEKPQAPSGLFAVHREDRIILSWSYPGNLRSSLKEFLVLRSVDGGFEKIGAVGDDRSSFIDETFRLDVPHRYKVVAQNLKGVISSDSNVITLIPGHVPPVPEDLHFAPKADSVELSWKSSGEGVCYNIYKTAERGRYSDVPLNKEPECTTSFRDSVVSPDSAVYYTVRALRKTGIRDEGYASAELEVNPAHFVPSPPADLRIVRGKDKVHLMWKESPEPWVKGYRVYRRRGKEQEFALLGQVRIPTFTDAEKIKGKVSYMIRALGPQSESEPLVGEVK
jgi:fibronectin type 3 domain-containing protein